MRPSRSRRLAALVTALAVFVAACGEDSAPASVAPPPEPPASAQEPVEAPEDASQEEARRVLTEASAAIRARDFAALEQHVAPEARREVLLLNMRDAFPEERWWEGLEAGAFPAEITFVAWERDGDRARAIVQGGANMRPVELVRRDDRWLVTRW